jgi:pyridoxal phosphate enzyme (YggS family)
VASPAPGGSVAAAPGVVPDDPWQASVCARVADVRDRMAAAAVRGGHGQTVTLVAVTKTHGPEAVRAAWVAGVRDVGENRLQEAEAKRARLGDLPVAWHAIGHVQRNKAQLAVTFDLVHGLDSWRLAEALDRAACEAARRCAVLVQLNLSGEASKFGLALAELPAFAERLQALPSLCVRGVMTMAPFNAPEARLRPVFAGARDALSVLREAGHPADVCSMGMSGDFEIAIEEGATHVRLGTILFGERAA